MKKKKEGGSEKGREQALIKQTQFSYARHNNKISRHAQTHVKNSHQNPKAQSCRRSLPTALSFQRLLRNPHFTVGTTQPFVRRNIGKTWNAKHVHPPLLTINWPKQPVFQSINPASLSSNTLHSTLIKFIRVEKWPSAPYFSLSWH